MDQDYLNCIIEIGQKRYQELIQSTSDKFNIPKPIIIKIFNCALSSIPPLDLSNLSKYDYLYLQDILTKEAPTSGKTQNDHVNIEALITTAHLREGFLSDDSDENKPQEISSKALQLGKLLRQR